MIALTAPAKVNLTLHVTGKRADNYHLLDSLVVFCDMSDRIEILPAPELSLTVTGPHAAGVPEDETNLVWKAAKLLSATKGAAITLHKHLPHGAGIGGGSSDAAATLRGLARLWDLALPAMEEIVALGADVPVCLSAPSPVRMRGIGEDLSPVQLPPMWLVLVNPGVLVATHDVFVELAEYGVENTPMTDLNDTPSFDEFAVWLADQRNDLAPVAMALCPEIEQITAELWNIDSCVDADMSGSGSTCRGVFETEQDATDAARQISAAHPKWWVRVAAVS